MNKLSRYLILACLILAGYTSIGIVLADTPSMPTFVEEAVGKAKECKRASHDSRKAGQHNTQLSDECGLACKQVYSLYQRQQDQESQLAQMERCTQLYSAYKSPDELPETEAEFPEITQMPSSVEEMVSRMSTMKPEGANMRDPCVNGVQAISRQQFNLEQATPYWGKCVNRYKDRMKADMKAKRIYDH